MPVVIKTTGLEQYAPGGAARVKMLNIGGPGVGKTRLASFFPKPIYADCEGGLASVADRQVPYATINTSQDMLDLLAFLKLECKMPADKRTYETIVIDTLDAYQRKLKAEWMDKNNKEAFTGWEAWGFLNQKMGLLLTRLLNLDMNIVVNVHYKDKTTKDDETGKETHELMLQLQGETADTAYNDFDLVGWTGTYWEAEGGERVLRRGITFKATPDKPFLKDRLHVTPAWLPIEFTEEDYLGLFSRISARVNELKPSDVVGEIPSEDENDQAPATVVRPDVATSGPLPSAEKVLQVPLAQLDKPSLSKMARDLGVTTLASGAPIRGNTLKAELIEAIEAHQAKASEGALATTPTPPGPSGATDTETDSTVETPVQEAKGASDLLQTEQGLVDPATGEVHDDGPPAVLEAAPPTQEQAVKTAEDVLGATVVADEITAEVPKETAAEAPVPAAAEALRRVRDAAQPAKKGKTCVFADGGEVCGKSLADEPNQDYVKLAWIRYRKDYCNDHYLAAKAAR